MAAMAISILWALIGFILLCGIIWLAFYVIETMGGMPIPDKIKQGIWLIVLLLALIVLISSLVGVGPIHFPAIGR
jgi:hypothetical protein